MHNLAVTKVLPVRLIAIDDRVLTPRGRFDTVLLRTFPQTQNHSRTRLLAITLCLFLHAVIVMIFLRQIGGGGRIGQSGSNASPGALVEVSIAPTRPAKSRQAIPSDAVMPPLPAKPVLPATDTGEQSKASRAIAETGAQAGGADEGQPAPAGQAANAMDFQQELFAHIQRFQVYPIQARQSGQQGRVMIVFVMSRAGAVLGVRIQTGSGYPLLDQAAVDAITRAQPLPRIPAEIADPLEVEIPIEFLLPQ